MRRSRLVQILLFSLFLMAGCKSTSQSASVKDVADIDSMNYDARLGRFIVVCQYHGPGDQPELVTRDQILANDVCNRGGDGGGGVALACQYHNGSFVIRDQDQEVSVNVGESPNAELKCGNHLAALYANNRLTVYSRQHRGFQSETIEESGQFPVKLQIYNDLVFFRGSYLAIFDDTTGAFSKQPFGSGDPDPDHLTFDPTLVSYYAGDTLFLYCGGAWKSLAADTRGKVWGSRVFDNIREFEIGTRLFRINQETCEWTRDWPEQRRFPDGTSSVCTGQNRYGSYARGGGCERYGCWAAGAGCERYGCWSPGGGCERYGCWQAGGGCERYGCWKPGGGCNRYGCWTEGGRCDSDGCVKGSPSFPDDKRVFACES